MHAEDIKLFQVIIIPHSKYQVNINQVFLEVFYANYMLQGVSKSLLTKDPASAHLRGEPTLKTPQEMEFVQQVTVISWGRHGSDSPCFIAEA